MSLYFVRHGQSVSNAGNAITMANHAIALTDIGRQQARAVIPFLPAEPAAIFSSPFLRARDTAEPYSQQCGLTVELLEHLREFEMIDPELLRGMNGAQRRPRAQRYWSQAKPTLRMGTVAESFQEFSARVELQRQQLHELPDNSVLFSHGMWMAMLFWQLLGFRYDDGEAMLRFRLFQRGFPVPNCAVYQLDCHGGYWHFRPREDALRSMEQIRTQNRH